MAVVPVGVVTKAPAGEEVLPHLGGLVARSVGREARREEVRHRGVEVGVAQAGIGVHRAQPRDRAEVITGLVEEPQAMVQRAAAASALRVHDDQRVEARDGARAVVTPVTIEP